LNYTIGSMFAFTVCNIQSSLVESDNIAYLTLMSISAVLSAMFLIVN
jgi:hypothetical protein